MSFDPDALRNIGEVVAPLVAAALLLRKRLGDALEKLEKLDTETLDTIVKKLEKIDHDTAEVASRRDVVREFMDGIEAVKEELGRIHAAADEMLEKLRHPTEYGLGTKEIAEGTKTLERKVTWLGQLINWHQASKSGNHQPPPMPPE